MIKNKHNLKEIKEFCPVCESELYVDEYTEYGIGTVERHVQCSKCTYREEMAYSKPLHFVCGTDTAKNIKKAQELGIEIIDKNTYEQM